MFLVSLLDFKVSTTTTKEGLLEDALMSPHELSSRTNLTPLIVMISLINWSLILVLFSLNYLNCLVIRSTI